MNFLLSGSLAYDTILIHEGAFHQRILPEQIARLNVAFGVDSMKEEFGGTAGNIAYNAAMLNCHPMLVSSIGMKNASNYLNHLSNLGIEISNLNQVENESVANAWVLTDQLNNQITGFYLGAMKSSPEVPLFSPCLWHLAPDTSKTTLTFAAAAIRQGKKYFLDPGQDLPSLLKNKDTSEHPITFKEAIKNASGLFVNEYEASLLKESFKLELEDLFFGSKLEFIVETKGGEGCHLILPDQIINFDVIKADKIVDPTGCGDSFRAGFISKYIKGESLEECVRMGLVMGSFAIEESGGQNHKPSLEDIENRLVSSKLNNSPIKRNISK